MESQKMGRLREMQLAFIGKLLAGLCHESKNHLAIIGESCGLIEDLLSLEEPGTATDIERYKKILKGINERIAQAAQMCRFLSGFSHRMDQPLSTFNITEVLQEEIYLLHRFARQKQVELTSSFEEDMAPIFNDPALLQFAIFCIVWPVMESQEKGDRILITANQQGSAAEITVNFNGSSTEYRGDSLRQEMLSEVLGILKAEYSEKTGQDGNQEIVVTLSSIKE